MSLSRAGDRSELSRGEISSRARETNWSSVRSGLSDVSVAAVVGALSLLDIAFGTKVLGSIGFTGATFKASIGVSKFASGLAGVPINNVDTLENMTPIFGSGGSAIGGALSGGKQGSMAKGAKYGALVGDIIGSGGSLKPNNKRDALLLSLGGKAAVRAAKAFETAMDLETAEKLDAAREELRKDSGNEADADVHDHESRPDSSDKYGRPGDAPEQ